MSVSQSTPVEFAAQARTPKLALVNATPAMVKGVRQLAPGRYLVPSNTTPGDGYLVIGNPGDPVDQFKCSCPWGAAGNYGCRHSQAARQFASPQYVAQPDPVVAALMANRRAVENARGRMAWVEEIA